MARTIVGTRIRERRRQMGITQTGLAAQIGISASYLNLIERNKRRITDALLSRVAEALAIEEGDLDGAAEERLLEALEEIAEFPGLRRLDIEKTNAGEFIGRFPGWARALAALARSEREANETARALADRLIHDPFLGETVHRMLTRIASIRSAAEILVEFSDVPKDQARRFLTIIYEESGGLSEVGEALAAYFDKSDEPQSRLTPVDEVEALFEHSRNRFDALEEAVEAARAETKGAAGEAAAGLIREAAGPVIETLLDQSEAIETEAARTRAHRALIGYADLAFELPLARFSEIAAAERYDVERIAALSGASFSSVARRLTTLPEEADMPRFGYFRANAAGTLTEMLGLPGLNVPRYASACPLWILFRAQQRPAVAMRQIALFPTGARFVFVARAEEVGPSGFDMPRHFLTDMIAISVEEAEQTVYAGQNAYPEEVGPACRICPRQNCSHRVEDPFVA